MPSCLIWDRTLPESYVYADRDLFGLKVTRNEGYCAEAVHGICKDDVLPCYACAMFCSICAAGGKPLDPLHNFLSMPHLPFH